jgi:hypothetical protein
MPHIVGFCGIATHQTPLQQWQVVVSGGRSVLEKGAPPSKEVRTLPPVAEIIL